MLSPRAPQGSLRCWLKGHFSLNTLQGEDACSPHVLRKGTRFVQVARVGGKDMAHPGRGHMLGWFSRGVARYPPWLAPSPGHGLT